MMVVEALDMSMGVTVSGWIRTDVFWCGRKLKPESRTGQLVFLEHHVVAK